MRVLAPLILFTLTSFGFSKDVRVVSVEDFTSRDFGVKRFTLLKEVDFVVKCRGPLDRRGEKVLSSGWILDSRTRRVVWEMNRSAPSCKRSGLEFQATEYVTLPQGSYEVYYSVKPGLRNRNALTTLYDVLSNIFDGSRRFSSADSWGISLYVDENDIEIITEFRSTEDKEPLVQLTPMGDEEFAKAYFSIDKRSRFRVYGVGEGDDGEMVDYGWICSGETGEPAWKMEYERTMFGGGEALNRIIDEEIILPAGDYVIYFVTDGSHSCDEWIHMVPYDPLYWGITLWCEEGDLDVRKVVPRIERNMIVDLTRVGDDCLEEDGFVLKKSARVRIICLGEYGYNNMFVDYGWIQDASSRRVVWKMSEKSSSHAGGAAKNRLFNGIITLKPGKYLVYYASDGSHSYLQWNSSPPYDPASWGMRLLIENTGSISEYIKPYSEPGDDDILLQIIRVGNREHKIKSLVLSRPDSLRIYSLGEGEDNEMFDYSWIEDDSGNIVWEMRYENTQHAGGAAKNRMVNSIVRLDSGRYYVHYKTDGSHSFDGWNEDPPMDRLHWGITIQKIEEKRR